MPKKKSAKKAAKKDKQVELSTKAVEKALKSVTDDVIKKAEKDEKKPSATSVEFSEKVRQIYKLGTQQSTVPTGSSLMAQIQGQNPEFNVVMQRVNREQIAFVVSDGNNSARCPAAGFFTVDG